MSRKKKNKSNVDQVLDEVMGEQKEDTSVSFDGDYTEEVDASPEELPQAEPADSELFQTDEYAEDEVRGLAEPETLLPTEFNLTVTIALAKPTAETEVLLWKSKPAGELESLLRHKAQHFARLHFGIDVSLNQVSQNLLDKCASDYRFAREMEKLTRQQ